MERGQTGRYEITTVGGESVRAFVPSPLPPAPPLTFEAGLQRGLEAAVLALRRLDCVSALLPDEAREGLPLSNRLIRDTHGVLLSRGRGSMKDRGEFSRSQN